MLADGYHHVYLHWVFDVKPDGKRKARLVANGSTTPPDSANSYCSVVSLRSFRICLLAAELNGLKTMVGDIGNAYLTAYTTEKVFTIAGSEFGELEGHTLVIVKALYGLRGSGAAYHASFAEKMRNMGFFPSYADPDLWMRDAGESLRVCLYVCRRPFCIYEGPPGFL